jgi:hypothetical protein
MKTDKVLRVHEGTSAFEITEGPDSLRFKHRSFGTKGKEGHEGTSASGDEPHARFLSSEKKKR